MSQVGTNKSNNFVRGGGQSHNHLLLNPSSLGHTHYRFKYEYRVQYIQIFGGLNKFRYRLLGISLHR